ncbi:hypothetical protein D9M73_283310 [compost metagenome]
MLVEAGRDEHVDLRRDHGERNESRAEHRELQLRQEIFQQRCVDELGILRSRDPDERPHQHVVDLLGEEETEDECERERE